MEDSVAKDQSSAHGRSASRLLRYPLRSGTKMKEEKPPLADSSNSSAPKRERLASSVSKSVGILDISGKEKSAKPPRRLSIPSKSNASPALKSFGNITPISEARGRKPAGSQGRSDTPMSDISKSSGRKKFSVLSSASYWLSQIKLSESASKHSVSIGFFKLALEAGCEPIQRMSDELKSYVRRHNNAELSESVKELFESYNISESFDQLQISGTCSQVPSECNHLTDDDDVRSSTSSITDPEKLQPKSIGSDADEICKVQKVNTESAKKNDLTKKTRKSMTESTTCSKSGSEIRGRNMQKKSQKPMKQESVKDKDKVKKQGRKSTRGGPLNSQPEEARQENKENMDVVPLMEETVLTEV